MSAAVEAPVPDEEEDMQADTATDAPVPSVTSAVRFENIVMGWTPKRKLEQKFFRSSVIRSNLSSSLDLQAEEQLRREATG